MRIPALISLVLIILISCNSNPKKSIAFYYWKTTYQLNNTEFNALDSLQVNKIYLRAFDIDKENEYSLTPKPIGVMIWKQKPLKNINYVPVIFIRNRVFEKPNYDDLLEYNKEEKKAIIELSKNIWKLVLSSWKSQGLSPTELQIDCDWTKGTKDSYFYFLEALKKECKIPISVTLRLHQIRDVEFCGIPPVEKTVLMCYNMGNMKDIESKNSIIDLEVTKNYLTQSRKYKLPYSIALPLFRWKLLFRNNKMIGIVHHLTEDQLKENFIKNNDSLYVYQKEFQPYNLANGFELKKGDIIRYEYVNQHEIDSVYNFIVSKPNSYNNELIYFDLDSTNLSYYEIKKLLK